MKRLFLQREHGHFDMSQEGNDVGRVVRGVRLDTNSSDLRDDPEAD